MMELSQKDEEQIFSQLLIMRKALENHKFYSDGKYGKMDAAEQITAIKAGCHALLNILETIEIKEMTR